MPKLPDATNLSGVNIGAPRSLVDIPVPDYAGAANAVAQGVRDVGTGVANFAQQRLERAQKQERFDTKMGMLKASEVYAERVRDLDPLDPDYVEKKKAEYRAVYEPILANVKDPENRQRVEEEALVDYTNIGIKAGEEQRGAFGKKAEIEISDYADGIRKKIRTGEYKGDAIAELRETIEDNQYLTQLEKDTLFKELGKGVDADLIEVEYENFTTKGVSVTREVQAAISAVENTEGVPSWLGGYLSRLATVESGGGRNMYNPENPGVVGVWQFTEGTARQVGLNPKDRIDVAKSTAAVVRLTAENASVLRNALGREPTPGELYLAHQQGAGGAVKILRNPDARAVDVLGKKQVELNLPKSMRGKTDTITAGQFAQLWTGKFERTGGRIDETEVLSIVEQSPAFRRMTPDEQDKVKVNILTRTEKLNKEAEKDAKISLQRDTVDYAVTEFEDRNEAERYVKDTLASDPEAREEALKMLSTQYNRIDEAEKVRYKNTLNETWKNVNEALDRNDITAAKRAIPTDGLDRKDIDELNKAINDDGIKDDPKVLDGLTALKIGNEQERRYFANVDGQGLNVSALRGVLTRDTLEALAKEQETFRKQYETNAGKLPTYDSAGKMLDLKLQELGVDVSAKASTTDIGYRTAMRRIMSQNVEAAVKRAGRDLTPSEMEQVLDETFLQFRAEKAGGQSAFDYLMGRPSEKTYTVKDVLDEYTTIEADYGALPGEYLTRAQKAIAAKGLDVTPARLRGWLKAAINAGVIKRNNEAE